jgi:hypothetical protein
VEFLDHTHVWDWCRANGYPLDEGADHRAPWLDHDLALNHRDRLVHSGANDVEASRKLSDSVLRMLGAWDSCLAWVTEWDVWETQEDWPAYYRWRGDHGERRSLGVAPGHFFVRQDATEFNFLLAHAIRCGWDVTLLPVHAGERSGVRIHCSHDGWIEVKSDKPVSFGAAAV